MEKVSNKWHQTKKHQTIAKGTAKMWKLVSFDGNSQKLSSFRKKLCKIHLVFFIGHKAEADNNKTTIPLH